MKAGIILVALLAAPAASDVYRCDAPGGGVTFSDSPCSTESERVDVQPSSGAGGAAPTGRSPQEQLRERSARRADEAAERAQAADERVRQMRDENYDADKCAQAKRDMARIRANDPNAHASVDLFQAQSRATLYCGPDAPQFNLGGVGGAGGVGGVQRPGR